MLKATDSVKYPLSSETQTLQPANSGVPAGAPKPLSLASLTAILAGGNIISTLLRMTGGILTARVVEPAVLGLFNGIGLVLGYAPLLHLGILDGLSRELPFYVGKKDNTMVRELAAAAQAWALLVGGLVALGLLGVSVWQLWRGDFSQAAGWATYAVSALILFYGKDYLQITYRTRHDFARLAAVGLAQNSVGLLLVLLVWWFSFYGLCLRSLAMEGVFLTLLWWWRPVRVAPSWNRARLWQLLKVGAPIFGTSLLYSWWAVLDCTLVLHYLGFKSLGFYALALMAGPALQLLPDALSQISYPRMAEQYGRTKRLTDLCRIVKRPIFWLTLGMAPVVLLSWFILPPLAKYLLPQYTDGVPAAQWALISAGLMSLAPVNNAFNVIRRQDFYFIAILLGMAIYIGSLMWLIRSGVYLAAFPQAMLAGRTIFLGACYFFVAYLRRREDSILVETGANVHK